MTSVCERSHDLGIVWDPTRRPWPRQPLRLLRRLARGAAARRRRVPQPGRRDRVRSRQARDGRAGLPVRARAQRHARSRSTPAATATTSLTGRRSVTSPSRARTSSTRTCALPPSMFQSFPLDVAPPEDDREAGPGRHRAVRLSRTAADAMTTAQARRRGGRTGFGSARAPRPPARRPRPRGGGAHDRRAHGPRSRAVDQRLGRPRRRVRRRARGVRATRLSERRSVGRRPTGPRSWVATRSEPSAQGASSTTARASSS